jgi:hypothetical protein
MKTKSVVLMIAVILFMLPLQSLWRAQAVPRRPTSLAADEAAISAEVGKIRVLEVAMMTAGEEKGADGYLSFYADDAVGLPAGAAMLQGKDNIRTPWISQRQE